MRLYIMLIKPLRTDGVGMYSYIKLKVDYMGEKENLLQTLKKGYLLCNQTLQNRH